MRKPRVDPSALLNMVYDQKVVTKAEMIALMGCSSMSLWRLLSAHGYLTSYNFNARYYTLSDIPRFDSNGLWFHERIGFSIHGALTEAVRALAANSKVGLTCAQLQHQLGVNVAPTLRRLCQTGDLFRQKYAGVFVYLAGKGNRRRAQLNERCRCEAALPAGPPPVEMVVAVLVKLI